MNVLFLTMTSGWQDVETSGIYTDLMRKFRDKGHNVYIIYPRERRLGLSTELLNNNGVYTLGVKTLNVTKTNVIEKGIGEVFTKVLKDCAVFNDDAQNEFDSFILDL